MKIVPGTFIATDGSGIVTEGHRVVCTMCNHDGFQINVIYLSNGEHTHLRCTNPACGACFCDQECAKGTTVFKDAKNKN